MGPKCSSIPCFHGPVLLGSSVIRYSMAYVLQGPFLISFEGLAFPMLLNVTTVGHFLLLIHLNGSLNLKLSKAHCIILFYNWIFSFA